MGADFLFPFAALIFVPAVPLLGGFGKIGSRVFARRSDASSLLSQGLIDNIVGTKAVLIRVTYASKDRLERCVGLGEFSYDEAGDPFVFKGEASSLEIVYCKL